MAGPEPAGTGAASRRSWMLPRLDSVAVASFIAYAGIGPLAAGLVIVLVGGLGNVSAAAALVILIRYAAVALSFLAGIRWGMALRLGGAKEELAVLLAAPVPVVLAWLSTLLAPPVALGLLAASFAGQGAWDVLTADQGRIPAWYGRLRARLTGGAVAILILTLLALLRQG